MRSHAWMRWAACALAMSICVPFVASANNRSVGSCTDFDQEDKGDDKVQFTIKNSCTIAVDCSISWRVVCAPASKKRRAVHPSVIKLALPDGITKTAEASAAICGDDAFAIDEIQWNCKPAE